jgi:hypothetical protein
MPRFKVSINWPQLDRERFLSDLGKAINQAIIKAARKYLLVASTIPVFTGFARGSLGNLEDIVGRVQGGQIRANKKGTTRVKKLQKKTWYYYPPGGGRVVRNNINGRQFSTPPDKILSEGKLTKGTTGSRMIFKFNVDITYVDFLDKKKWKIFDKARTAFNEELKTQFDRLKPDPGKYLIRREIR